MSVFSLYKIHQAVHLWYVHFSASWIRSRCWDGERNLNGLLECNVCERKRRRSRMGQEELSDHQAEPTKTLPAHQGPTAKVAHWKGSMVDRNAQSLAGAILRRAWPSQFKSGPERINSERQSGNHTPRNWAMSPFLKGVGAAHASL